MVMVVAGAATSCSHCAAVRCLSSCPLRTATNFGQLLIKTRTAAVAPAKALSRRTADVSLGTGSALKPPALGVAPIAITLPSTAVATAAVGRIEDSMEMRNESAQIAAWNAADLIGVRVPDIGSNGSVEEVASAQDRNMLHAAVASALAVAFIHAGNSRTLPTMLSM